MRLSIPALLSKLMSQSSKPVNCILLELISCSLHPFNDIPYSEAVLHSSCHPILSNIHGELIPLVSQVINFTHCRALLLLLNLGHQPLDIVLVR